MAQKAIQTCICAFIFNFFEFTCTTPFAKRVKNKHISLFLSLSLICRTVFETEYLINVK